MDDRDAKRAVEDRLRAALRVVEAPGRTVAAFNEAALTMAAQLREWVDEVVRVNWPTVRRMELAEHRAAAARRAKSRPVLTKSAESAIREGREHLREDADVVRCPPSVLLRAWLLEDETTRASPTPRPGRRSAPITVEESLRVWTLREHHELSYPQIDLVHGIPERRARRIMEYLEPDKMGDGPR